MPKPLTNTEIVKRVELAKIHLGCAIPHLEVLASRMEATSPSKRLWPVQEITDAIDALVAAAKTLEAPPWSDPVHPESSGIYPQIEGVRRT